MPSAMISVWCSAENDYLPHCVIVNLYNHTNMHQPVAKYLSYVEKHWFK